MDKENAFLKIHRELEHDFEGSLDFDELEKKLSSQIEKDLSDLNFLESERRKIGNPSELGKVIKDEVWTQFCNQIGLDVTKETLNQKYDRENPNENYKDVATIVMQDERYRTANKKMKDEHEKGVLKDEYTGKVLKPQDKANQDHVVSRKEIYENKRRKQANIKTEDLANKDINLRATNESLNKSKGAKSINEYIDPKKRAERERSLKGQNERANSKIDKSNMSENEKKISKEKNNKRLQNKLDAKKSLMQDADKKARRSQNRDVRRGVAKQVGKKAGKDALKTMAIQALSSLLKEVMNGLVTFFKSESKSFKLFLLEMKKSISNFFNKIEEFFKSGLKVGVSTIVSEIFGPIVSVFNKLVSVIKQSVSSFIDAIAYLKAPENKYKPFSIKVAQVGKIVTGALTGITALVLGEVLEKSLMSFPIMLIEIPFLGTLANIIGLFLGSLVSGLIGAIVINLIDKYIAKRQKAEIVIKKIDKANNILENQSKILNIKEAKLNINKDKFATAIIDRHNNAAEIFQQTLENTNSEFDTINENDKRIDKMLKELEGLYE